MQIMPVAIFTLMAVLFVLYTTLPDEVNSTKKDEENEH